MNKEILEIVKKRVDNFNKKHNITAEFLSPIKSTDKAFAICGQYDELEKYQNQLCSLFSDLEIYYNVEFILEMHNGHKTVLYCYELNNKDE